MSTERREGPYSRAIRAFDPVEEEELKKDLKPRVTTRVEDDLLAEVSRAYSEGSR